MIGSISQRETKQGTKYLAQLPPSMGRVSKSFTTRYEAEQWLALQGRQDEDFPTSSVGVFDVLECDDRPGDRRGSGGVAS